MKTIIHTEYTQRGKIVSYDDGTRESIRTPEPLQNILKQCKLNWYRKAKSKSKVLSDLGYTGK